MATVMIADDTVFMRTALKKLLSEAGFKVVAEAENGEVAVSQYQQHKPDVVMLDITMPVMDGLAALQAIKQADPDASVVMCTALGQERIVMQAMDYGAKDYIIKPFKPEKVIEAIKKASTK